MADSKPTVSTSPAVKPETGKPSAKPAAKPAAQSAPVARAAGKPAAQAAKASKPASPAKPASHNFSQNSNSGVAEANDLQGVVETLIKGTNVFLPELQKTEPGSLRSSIKFLGWHGLDSANVDKYTIPKNAIEGDDAAKDSEKAQMDLFVSTLINKDAFNTEKFFSRNVSEDGKATLSLPPTAALRFEATAPTQIVRLGKVNPKKTAEQAAISESQESEIVNVPQGATFTLTNAEVLQTFQRNPGFYALQGNKPVYGLDPAETEYQGGKAAIGINFSRSKSSSSSSASADSAATNYVTSGTSLNIKAYKVGEDGKRVNAFLKLAPLFPIYVTTDDKKRKLDETLVQDKAQGQVSNEERWADALSTQRKSPVRSESTKSSGEGTQASRPATVRVNLADYSY